MKKLCERKIYASEISEYLGIKWAGTDFYVFGPASITSAEPGRIVFYNGEHEVPDITNLLIITKEVITCKRSSVILVQDPEIAFYQVINEFYLENEISSINKEAEASTSANISRGVSIGRNSIIGSDVTIGANSYIGAGVVIRGKVNIGKNCIIKDNAVLGSEGYHFIDNGVSYINKPCLGQINIKDNVLIGSNTSVELPLFDETVIGPDVKIDDLVNIGSNCLIGAKTRIAAGSILCHRVSVGQECFIGAGAVIRDSVPIGNHCIIGIGAVVLNTVGNNKRVAGNPAHEL
jgi:UDP-3-O-[3-hydroxymyristoyl] glucosamine N-acyltransferase